ncbi:protein SIEVE ELEMENT OCCLUSION B-like [Carya illinoinensis]|uniref:protein SIEVE ELEMENT OCCLUSION B-like n=1 Tax=Carya illinoinensis TaxID=32201 RepID=UPI001C71B24C|nr:protein SIEVE ELEMENT OCCLUSION B-like [Carya illinoinensis]
MSKESVFRTGCLVATFNVTHQEIYPHSVSGTLMPHGSIDMCMCKVVAISPLSQEKESAVKMKGYKIIEEDIEKLLDHFVFMLEFNCTEIGTQGLEKLEGQMWMADHSSQLWTLEQLSLELAQDGEIELKTTLISILSKLSGYSWAAKAVLTLAAFALNYGDFWDLSQVQSLDRLANSVGITKPVTAILNRPDIRNCKKAIGELSNMIKDTLEVIECIVELENYHAQFKCAVLVKMSKFLSLTCSVYHVKVMNSVRRDKILELLPLSKKMNVTLNLLKMQIEECHQQIGEVKAYWRMMEIPVTPTKIVEAFKALILSEENLQQLIDGSTNKMLSIDVLKKKSLLLFISAMDISIEEISILNPIFNGTREEEQYKIVWIPVVGKWSDEMQAKFEILRSNIAWYILPYFSSIVDNQFITEEWHFKNKPIVVVINQQGVVEHPNALRMIRLWGMKAFPFTITIEKELIPEEPRPEFSRINRALKRPFVYQDDEDYTFFFGFANIKWKQRFTSNLTKMSNDWDMKNSNTRIRWFLIGEGNEEDDVQKLVNAKLHDPRNLLYSFKSDSGWVVLRKVPDTTVVSDHGTSILKVLEKLGSVKKFGFQYCFENCYRKL